MFSSNVLSALGSAIIMLIIPRFISVEHYGYYQLYLFYVGYTGVSYLGWCEGMNLREGGQYYEKLDKPLHCTQFWLLGLYEVILFLLLFSGSLLVTNNVDKQFTIGFVCFAGVGMCLRWFITFLLPATGRVRECAIIIVSEKIVSVILSVSAVLLGYRGFKLIIFFDAMAKYVSLSVGVFFCQDMVFSKLLPIKNVLHEIRENISAGLKLMLASLCSMLIIGIVRFGIERRWDIEAFSIVSLTLNISNVVLTAINAVAVVLYPMLRRMDEKSMPKVYGVMRLTLMSVIFGGIILYYPAQKLLSAWLPQYVESLRYTAILLPICAYESKMSMLVNTYYKTLRLETLLMKCNMAALALSVVCTLISTLVLNSVTAAILSILIVLIFRCVISELLLTKHINIQVAKDIMLELIMTVAFIICNWYFGFAGMVAYAGCYVAYLVIKRRDIKETFNFIKSMG